MTVVTATRRIEILPIGANRDEIYNLIKYEMRTQNRALNAAYSHLYFNYIAREKLKALDSSYVNRTNEMENKLSALYKNLYQEKGEKKIDELNKRIAKEKESLNKLRKAKTKEAFETFGNAIGIAEQTQLRDILSNEFKLMSDTKDRITSIVNSDFSNDITGILKGERTLRTYKNNPLYIRGRSLIFEKEGRDYYIKWRNKSTCFKVLLGRKPSLAQQIKLTMDGIILSEYKVCDSLIQYKNKKLYLLLTIQHEKQTVHLETNRTVGVDIGMNVSAYCVLNINPKYKKAIGDEKLLLDFKNKMRALRRKANRSAQASNSGHGRRKKLRYLEELKEREKNFTKTYNHNISHAIVKFALDHKAGVIRLEKLNSAGLSNETLMNWTYYQLQSMIEYKAHKWGIYVEYIPAAHTSSTCSHCGNNDKNNRYDKNDRTKFKCTSCGLNIHADLNAAINIATKVSNI